MGKGFEGVVSFASSWDNSKLHASSGVVGLLRQLPWAKPLPAQPPPSLHSPGRGAELKKMRTVHLFFLVAMGTRGGETAWDSQDLFGDLLCADRKCMYTVTVDTVPEASVGQ
eukprot:scaffold215429_cov23-Tisochrysis_lutea.AAC.1